MVRKISIEQRSLSVVTRETVAVYLHSIAIQLAEISRPVLIFR